MEIKWRWSGDIYALEGFQIIITKKNIDIFNALKINNGIYYKTLYCLKYSDKYDTNNLIKVEEISNNNVVSKLINLDFNNIANVNDILNIDGIASINNPNNWKITSSKLTNNIISHNQSTNFDIEINTKGLKYFKIYCNYDISSESNYDYFKVFYYNGSSYIELFRDSGIKTNVIKETNFTQLNKDVLKLRLQYMKNKSTTSGSDCVYLHNFNILLQNTNDTNIITEKYSKIFTINVDIEDYVNENDEYDIWIRPLYYLKNGNFYNLNTGKIQYISEDDEPIINDVNTIFKKTKYSYDTTKISGDSIATGTITLNQFKGNILKLGGDKHGEIKVKNNNNEDIVIINNQGIQINNGRLIIKDNNENIVIDEKGVKANNVSIQDKLIIGSNKNNVLYNKNINNDIILLMDKQGVHVYNDNNSETILINNEGIDIKNGYFKILNNENYIIFDENGFSATTVFNNNLIIGSRKLSDNNYRYYNGKLCFYNSLNQKTIEINRNGVIVYDVNNNKVAAELKKGGFYLYDTSNVQTQTIITPTYINANYVETNGIIIHEFYDTQNLLSKKSYILLYDDEGKERLNINKNGIFLKSNKDDGTTSIDIQENNIKIKNGAFRILDENNEVIISIDEQGIGTKRLYSSTSNPIIKLFENCALDATENNEQGIGNEIRLKWDRRNYVLIGKNRFNVFLDAVNIFEINENFIRYKDQQINMDTILNKAQTQNQHFQINQDLVVKLFNGLDAPTYNNIGDIWIKTEDNVINNYFETDINNIDNYQEGDIVVIISDVELKYKQDFYNNNNFIIENQISNEYITKNNIEKTIIVSLNGVDINGQNKIKLWRSNEVDIYCKYNKVYKKQNNQFVELESYYFSNNYEWIRL